VAVLDGEQGAIERLDGGLGGLGAGLKLTDPRAKRRHAAVGRAALGERPEDGGKGQAHCARRRRQHQFVCAHRRPGESTRVSLRRALRSIRRDFQREWDG
jgi:hypothetical protein